MDGVGAASKGARYGQWVTSATALRRCGFWASKAIGSKFIVVAGDTDVQRFPVCRVRHCPRACGSPFSMRVKDATDRVCADA